MSTGILDLLFRHETIDGHGRCEPYLDRWHLLRLPWKIRVYLHRFNASDWSRDLHDHPKRFISIGLWGSYEEESCSDPELTYRDTFTVYRAPWVRTFPAAHTHRLIVNNPPVWTLVITLWEIRCWGFRTPDGAWVPFLKYIRSGRADEAKDC